MSRIICHHGGRYNIYCTISDGFVFVSSLSLSQLEYYIKREYGEYGLDILGVRLERAIETGSSDYFTSSLDDFLSCNRAGEKEEHLSTEECIRRFLS